MTLFSLSGLKAEMRETHGLSVYAQIQIKKTGSVTETHGGCFCPLTIEDERVPIAGCLAVHRLAFVTHGKP